MLDLYRQASLADPTEYWASLRHDRVTIAPLSSNPLKPQSIPVLSRYSDVNAALRSSGRAGSSFSNQSTLTPLYQPCGRALQYLRHITAAPVTAAGDPPFHTEMRQVLDLVFPRRQPLPQYLQQTINTYTRQLLDQIGSKRSINLGELATHLPLQVIMYLIGAPRSDWANILVWSDRQIDFIWGRPQPARQIRLAKNLLAFWQYCEHLAGRKDLPPNSITARLLKQGVSPHHVASFAFNLLVAGHETTRYLIANTLHMLLSHPGQWKMIEDNRSLVPTAVAETNRYMPPIIGWLRQAQTPVQIGNHTIDPGTRVLLHLGAANRDMPDGDRFDVMLQHHGKRTPALSFGAGPHFCIGAALATYETEAALGQVLDRFPKLTLHSRRQPQYARNLGFRGPNALWVMTH